MSVITIAMAENLRAALDARAEALLVTRANDEPYMEGYFDARSVALAAPPSGAPVEGLPFGVPPFYMGGRASREYNALNREPVDPGPPAEPPVESGLDATALRRAWIAHFNHLHTEAANLSCLDAILTLAAVPEGEQPPDRSSERARRRQVHGGGRSAGVLLNVRRTRGRAAVSEPTPMEEEMQDFTAKLRAMPDDGLVTMTKRQLLGLVEPEAEGATPAEPPVESGLDAKAVRCRDLPYDAHDWDNSGSPSFCRDCGMIFPRFARLAAVPEGEQP